MGVHLGLTRLYGRATPGERVSEGTPIYGPHYTTIAAIGLLGVVAPWLFEGAMTTLAFETYLQCELIPTLRRGDIVLLDNLSSHKSAEAQRLIEARGARLLFLPPYSSDLNPIELCWSKVIAALRTAIARSFVALLAALAAALRSVSLPVVVVWFAHCSFARSYIYLVTALLRYAANQGVPVHIDRLSSSVFYSIFQCCRSIFVLLRSLPYSL